VRFERPAVCSSSGRSIETPGSGRTAGGYGKCGTPRGHRSLWPWRKVRHSRVRDRPAGRPALGVLTSLRTETLGSTPFCVALIGLGVNYVPLLIHAIDLVRQSAIEAAIADE